MKKNARKLTLSKETVRSLERTELSRAVWGGLLGGTEDGADSNAGCSRPCSDVPECQNLLT